MRHEEEAREAQCRAAAARRQREQLEWLASFSPRHEREWRDLQEAERAEREAEEREQQEADRRSLAEYAWNPALHPRIGGPPNAGWFAAKDDDIHGASGGGGGTPGPEGPTSGEPSGKPAASTKIHLPADHRGTWVEGTKGDGVFQYHDTAENRAAGLAGKKVRYENQHIAVNAFPPEAYYGGSAEAARVQIKHVTGTKADAKAADAAMRERLGDPNWQRPEGMRWHHAGGPGSNEMELVQSGVHRSTAHTGPAAKPRAELRANKTVGARPIETRSGGAKGGGGGKTARAIGVLNVYMAARDVAQMSGALGPDYEERDNFAYEFEADDGSRFVVEKDSWLWGPFGGCRRKFVSGPRKGQTETITRAEFDEYTKRGEEVWGKYIPGHPPRFIPGTKRKTIPYYEEHDGIMYERGYIDEDGVHITNPIHQAYAEPF